MLSHHAWVKTKCVELVYDNDSCNVEDHVEISQGSKQGAMHQGHPMALESLGLSFRQ